ncbi:MAG: hypothetical protein HGA45_26155 [Chloroflexales bacterium]|nr:hypothetical protein [Chloroflexales bacterium]
MIMPALQPFRLGAAVLLLAILVAAVLYWPLPMLGVSADPATGEVVVVAEGLPGALAGVQLGDQIVQFYGHPWAAFNTRLFVVPLPWRDGTPSPMTVRRGDELRSLTLMAGPPDLALQADKALRTLVALVCWSSGVALGTSRQKNNRQLQWAAWFWVLLGGALGIYQLAQTASYVLTVGVLWVLATFLAPTAVMMHLWYPSRPLSPTTLVHARRWWLITIGLLQLAALGLAAFSGTTTALLERLDTATTVVFLACFGLSGLILWRAYRETRIAHIRRQIRLIATACVIVACAWTMLLLGEVLAPAIIAAIPPVMLTACAALVPLAYLYGGIGVDLLWADLLARQIRAHAYTLVVIMVLATVVTRLGLVQPTPLLIAVIMVAAYQPVFQLVRWLWSHVGTDDPSPEGLSQVTTQLSSTLDADQLAAMLSAGLWTMFREPPVAVYLRRETEADALERAAQRQLTLPLQITPALIAQVFHHEEAILPIGAIQQRVGQAGLEDADAALVFAPLVNLWGRICDGDGTILGLVVLGARGDRDPYREPDLRALTQLLGAAALAFANSASYGRQVQAQQLIRQLYRHLQQAQDQTASTIAREIHDEVLNVNVRLNIQALEYLVTQASVAAPALSEELQALLESEQSTGTLLRLICEQLRPAYSDDPLGLVASLRRVVEQLGVTWEGRIRLEVERLPCPVDRQLHRELVLIAREAVTNAIKHAVATEIVVALSFPPERDAPLTLTIRDNGLARQQVAPKAGHIGLHFMQESADTIGATIAWLPQATGGIAVQVVAPIAGREDDSLGAAMPRWWVGEAAVADEGWFATVAPVADTDWPNGKDERNECASR